MGFEAADNMDAYTKDAHERFRALPMPELDLIHAIHNQGHGDKIRGARARAEGVKAGIPDIFWPVPLNTYHGLYIELKKPKKGRTSSVQDEMLPKLEAMGYCVVVAYGWREAADAVIEYCE